MERVCAEAETALSVHEYLCDRMGSGRSESSLTIAAVTFSCLRWHDTLSEIIDRGC